MVQGQVGLFFVVEVHGLVDQQAGLGQVVGQHKEEFIFYTRHEAVCESRT